MSSNALYYPYIRVPENPWFTRVLLYWDRVGAIVPYDYLENPEHLGPYMLSLVRENLVEQVVPGMHLWRVKNFTESFLDYADAKYGKGNEPYFSNWAAVHAQKLGGASIHMEKLHDLAERLCERGLAQRNADNPYSPWLKLEPRIADDFMAYLAGVLGQIAGDDSFSPITNRRNHLDPFIGTHQQHSGNTKLKIREILLESILPAPSESLDVLQLLDFKHKYQEPLHRFRREIEERISELAVISDEELQGMRLNDITGCFRETIDEIVARMQEQRDWPQLDFGTLCTVAGSGMSAWKAVIDQDWKFGVTGAALSLAPAVYTAFRGSKVDLTDKPLAYAALSRTQFQ